MKPFKLRDILTLTTGRLLTEAVNTHDNGIGNLYEIIDYMLDTAVFTHQLGEYSKLCSPRVLEMYPALGNVDLGRLDILLADTNNNKAHIIDVWVETETSRLGLDAEYLLPVL